MKKYKIEDFYESQKQLESWLESKIKRTDDVCYKQCHSQVFDLEYGLLYEKWEIRIGEKDESGLVPYIKAVFEIYPNGGGFTIYRQVVAL